MLKKSSQQLVIWVGFYLFVLNKMQLFNNFTEKPGKE